MNKVDRLDLQRRKLRGQVSIFLGQPHRDGVGHRNVRHRDGGNLEVLDGASTLAASNEKTRKLQQRLCIQAHNAKRTAHPSSLRSMRACRWSVSMGSRDVRSPQNGRSSIKGQPSSMFDGSSMALRRADFSGTWKAHDLQREEGKVWRCLRTEMQSSGSV